jgi:hypothetical protein
MLLQLFHLAFQKAILKKKTVCHKIDLSLERKGLFINKPCCLSKDVFGGGLHLDTDCLMLQVGFVTLKEKSLNQMGNKTKTTYSGFK